VVRAVGSTPTFGVDLPVVEKPNFDVEQLVVTPSTGRW